MAVRALAAKQAYAGYTVEMHGLGSAGAPAIGDMHEYSEPWWGRAVGASPAMSVGLKRSVKAGDIVHSHGWWRMPAVYAYRAASAGGAPLVISGHGVFEPWALAQRSLRKSAAMSLVGRRVLESAMCLHATSEAEVESYRALGLRQPIALVPLGVDIPEEYSHIRKAHERRRVLFLGRLDPKKRVDELLRAWSAVEPLYPGWELVIAGPGNERYRSHLVELADRLQLRRADFFGPAWGTDKASLFRSADLFVLPTFSENYGLTVAEALSYGVPAIVSQGAPWKGLEDHGCGWWIGSGDAATLASVLKETMAMQPQELSLMGKKGRDWVVSDHSWAAAGDRMDRVYEWVLGQGPTPDFVLF